MHPQTITISNGITFTANKNKVQGVMFYQLTNEYGHTPTKWDLITGYNQESAIRYWITKQTKTVHKKRFMSAETVLSESKEYWGVFGKPGGIKQAAEYIAAYITL